MSNFEQQENLYPNIEISHSIEDEIWRVKYTLPKYKWYVENRYNPILPSGLKEIIEKGEAVTDKDIENVIRNEYRLDVYQAKAREIQDEWERESKDFFGKIIQLGRPLPQSYQIHLTRYGVGGSYGLPSDIQLNISTNFEKGVLWVIFHEIVHLAIEDLIKMHDIHHWTKERLVDLIINKFFPEQTNLQTSPENDEEIRKIFESEFPNIEKIIFDVSNIK